MSHYYICQSTPLFYKRGIVWSITYLIGISGDNYLTCPTVRYSIVIDSRY